ncbi:MAG: hypothetical protein DRJ62_03210 [Thermoprotei archaeon]|nr:MAG: hypothetical protein DRJ62_03210 [Thermoprotei archaeon]
MLEVPVMSFLEDLVFIAGGGVFGSHAVREAKRAGLSVLVADIDESCRARELVDLVVSLEELEEHALHLKPSRAVLVAGDAVEVLVKACSLKIKPSLVVPTVPGHFAGRLYKRFMEGLGVKVESNSDGLSRALKVFPQDLLLKVDCEVGLLVASYMPRGLYCKTPCDQPLVCPVTGLRRAKAMFEVVEEALSKAELSLVLRSLKLGAYSGGFKLRELEGFISESLRRAERSGAGVSVAIATSCRCHAIANFFSISRSL